MKEVKETGINIFDWLKPKQIKTSTPSPLLEEDEIIEKELEVERVKIEKKEKLLRMKKRQDTWKMTMDIKLILEEVISETMRIITRKIC